MPPKRNVNFDSTEMDRTVSDAINRAMLHDDFTHKLSDIIKNIIKPMIEESLEPLKDEIQELRDENKKLKADYELSVDQLEQHGRSNSLRFFKMPALKNPRDPKECDKVVCDIVKKHLKIDLKPEDIDISHPLGKPYNGRITIIVKFVRRSVRHLIYRNKKLFSTTKAGCVPNPHRISIGEDLTRPRQRIMKRLNILYKREKIASSWTYNGDIFFKINEADKDGTKFTMIYNCKDAAIDIAVIGEPLEEKTAEEETAEIGEVPAADGSG